MEEVRVVNIAIELWGMIFSIIGVICIGIIADMDPKYKRLLKRVFWCNACFMLSDAVAGICRGKLSLWGIIGTHVGNFSLFVSEYILLALFTDYMATCISEHTKKPTVWNRYLWGGCILAIVMVIVSQFNGMLYYIDADNLYHRGEFFWLSNFYGAILIIVNLCVLYKYRKVVSRSELVSFSQDLILPIIAIIIQTFVYGLAFLHIATTIIVLLIFFNIQSRLAEQYCRKEMELSESRVEVVMSQIQPHFLYNSLDTIYYLCEKDPKRAQQAVGDFSEYLRVNLSALSRKTPVPIEAELKHVEIYLMLEKMSSDDELNFLFDIQTAAFSLPALTVQPLVENAVKHGIGKKEGGGTVKISTREYPDRYEVIVSDDGIGFDPEEKRQDGRLHIGIENVRQRLSFMCGGVLDIQSTPGQGTLAIMKIPKGGGQG